LYTKEEQKESIDIDLILQRNEYVFFSIFFRVISMSVVSLLDKINRKQRGEFFSAIHI